MISQEKIREELHPRIHVWLNGKNYYNIKNFRLTGDILCISDGFSFELPSPKGEGLELLQANVHRWFPIKIWHSDPLVMQGKPRLQLTGVVTAAEYRSGSGPSTLSIRGYNLGKLLDSCGPAWKRFGGSTWGELLKLLLDPSWMEAERKDGWGFKEPIGFNLSTQIKLGREGAMRAYYRKVQEWVVPIQIQVGELIHDTLSRHARLIWEGHIGGCLINVSADGHIQLMNPEDQANDLATYVFEYHPDTRNQRIKSVTIQMNGEPLYSDYTCYSSSIRPPKIIDARDTHAGARIGYFASPFPLGDPKKPLKRRMTFGDGEQYTEELAKKRAHYRCNRATYEEETITCVIQGHSMPGPNGEWIPIVEGTIVDYQDSFSQRNQLYYMHRVELHQSEAPQGTTSICSLKKKGILSA